MRVVGHRTMDGPNLHRDGPVDVLFLRNTPTPDQKLAEAFAKADVKARWDDLGDAIGAIAVHLARAVDPATPDWHATARDDDGDLLVLTPAHDEVLARHAVRAARDLVAAALDGATPDLVAAQTAIAEKTAAEGPPAATRNLLRVARARGIPVTRLPGADHWQLGWGAARRRLWQGVPGHLSGLGVEIAGDHERAKETLASSGIRIPRVRSARTLAGLEEAAKELGYPVAVKPLRGRGGVTPEVRNETDLEAAYDLAKTLNRWVVVEDHIRGLAHELLVVGGKVVSAIRQDADGSIVDVSDSLHPATRLAAERAVRLCQADIAAVMITAPTVAEPLAATGGAIVAIDPTPDHSRHEKRHAASMILDAMFPSGNGRVPLIAVTGTNGKTTTVRLLSHVLKLAGCRVGLACTGTVEVENHTILRGDYSGPGGAGAVLREPSVTHAVVEVARGGILRRGLGFDKCDVSVFTNVASDHLGQGGVHTLEDLARVKAVVARSATRAAVLNADDPRVWATRHEVKCRVVPFTLDPHHPDVAAHLAADPTHIAVTVRGEDIVVLRGGSSYEVANVLDVPITLSGAATFNVQNAMAAVAAATALGAPEAAVRAGLTTFNPTTGQNPGRMNLLDLGGVKVLLDYGHNVPALQALAHVLPRLAPGRRINVANAAGNRRDEDLRAFGAQVARMYDRILVCDPDPRKRQHGHTAALIRDGILSTGFDETNLTVELDELRAARRALAESRPGDLVVLQLDDITAVIELCTRLRARLEAGESPADINMELLSN